MWLTVPPDRRRWSNLKIIGAGLSRTGTMSTQAALELLGYPCYHMTEVGRAQGHLDAWNTYFAGQSQMDWPVLLQNYAATVDTPCCLYYQELMAAFPSARVLLNLRDPDRWYESLVALATTLEEFRPLAAEHPRLAVFLSITDAVGMKLTNGDLSRDNCVKAFHQHNEAVQAFVPRDRLLVFQVQDGWTPLCNFLDLEEPDEPFPHLNEGRSTVREFVQQHLLDGS